MPEPNEVGPIVQGIIAQPRMQRRGRRGLEDCSVPIRRVPARRGGSVQ